MKKFIPAVIALSMILAFGGNAMAGSIAFIDGQKALLESMAGKDAYGELQKFQAAKQDDLNKQQAEIKALAEDLQTKALTLSDEAKQDMELEYQQKMRALQLAAKEAEEELQRKEATLLKPVSEDIKNIIEQYGKDKGLDMIIDIRVRGIHYYNASSDITDKIIEMANKKYTKK